MQLQNRFNQVPIKRLVMQLGIPAMAAQVINILYTIVDRVFVSYIDNGMLALASIGICGPLITAITGFAFMSGTGGSTVFSISLGEDDQRQAKLSMFNSLVLTLILSILITVIILIIKEPLIFTLGSSQAMYPFANTYLSVYCIGITFNLISLAMNQFILAQGFSILGMISIFLGATINIILDPIFIFGFSLGIAGAAIATVIAQFVVMIFVLIILIRKSNPIPMRIEKLSFKILFRIISIGLMPLMITFLDNFIIIALNIQLRRYSGAMGDTFLACATIVSSFMSVTVCLSGITQGCATLFGFHFGAKHLKKLLELFWEVFKVCAIFLLALTVISVGFPQIFVSLFTRNPIELEYACYFIRIYTFGIIGIGVQYAIVDGLVAMGQIKYSLPCSLIRKFIYLACLFIIPIFFPIEQIFWSGTISDILGASITLLIFFKIVLPHLKKELN